MMTMMNMMLCVGWFLPVLLHLAGYVCGVRITDLDIPTIAIEGDEVHLRCDYEAEGGSSLYTLKWYKDKQEFYRHQPGISPHTADDRCSNDNIYTVMGVNVDCWVSTEREVVLKTVSLTTSGEYTCEVIGEHPKFRKETRNEHLTVYSEPLQSPLLTGKEESYTPRDIVALAVPL
ncbi:uncharacterized protein LOC121856361 [Homarus americanus]|uniref:uncharacterized protein LOC121856361 n=1 Tax=Homarus americanus TaxID=6706 RepID=UPI001C479252|nr:uncharacterized protein LOC121856361 [Homarus americanus]